MRVRGSASPFFEYDRLPRDTTSARSERVGLGKPARRLSEAQIPHPEGSNRIGYEA